MKPEDRKRLKQHGDKMNEILECLEHGAGTCRNADMIDELVAELARRDEIITRLKEDAERLASTYVAEVYPHEWVCRGCYHSSRDHPGGEPGLIEHAPNCPITLHRALEEKYGGEVSDINFEVPGIPVAKQSTRFTTKGKRPHAYPDKNVEDWQTTVGQYAMVARADHSWEMTREPVAVKLVFRLPDRRKRDIDNLEKCVLDGLKGVLFEDDDQVVQVTKRKVINKDHPGVTIIVELDNPVEDCE